MKKIRINLYGAEFKPKKIILSLPQMVLIWAVVGVLMVSLAYYSHVKRVGLEQEEERISTELDDQTIVRDSLQARVSAQVLDKSLERELNELKVLEETKGTLIDIMQKKNILKSHGYAGFMEDLAKITRPGISLSHIKLNETSADLYGMSSGSSLVPKWVSSFGKTDELSKFSFGGIRMEANAETGLIDFSLTRENPLADAKADQENTPNIVGGKTVQDVVEEGLSR